MTSTHLKLPVWLKNRRALSACSVNPLATLQMALPAFLENSYSGSHLVGERMRKRLAAEHVGSVLWRLRSCPCQDVPQAESTDPRKRILGEGGGRQASQSSATVGLTSRTGSKLGSARGQAPQPFISPFPLWLPNLSVLLSIKHRTPFRRSWNVSPRLLSSWPAPRPSCANAKRSRAKLVNEYMLAVSAIWPAWLRPRYYR